MPVTTSEQLDLLLSLFRGRQDVYARYWEKGDRSGYSPAYEFDWAEFRAFKNKGGTLKEFPNKRLMPLWNNQGVFTPVACVAVAIG